MQPKLKMKKDDEVIVIAGKDKGKRGKIVKVLPENNRVVVAGVNLVKRHERANRNNPNGGIVTKEAALHVSNVALIDPKDGKPTRVGYKSVDGKKVRVAKRSGEELTA
jgi:large subunit ribosomal protein L24